MKHIFVTASGTGVGKTLVTRLLCRQARAAGASVLALKPVISGYDAADPNSDTRLLLEAQGRAAEPTAIERVSPWRFAAPLSPDMAARREGRSLDFAALVEHGLSALAGPEDLVLIEGIGGVMVPLTETETVLHWIVALGAPVLLVTGSYLGSLSHTLTAARALETAGARPMAVIVSESEDNPAPVGETMATLARFLDGVPVLALPRLDVATGAGAPDLLRALG